MAGWVRFVWWPLMVVFTIGGVGWLAQGIWGLVVEPGIVPALIALLGLAWTIGIAREWPRWREVTFPERRERAERVDRADPPTGGRGWRRRRPGGRHR